MSTLNVRGRYFQLTSRLARWWAAPGRNWLFRSTGNFLVTLVLFLAGWLLVGAILAIVSFSIQDFIDTALVVVAEPIIFVLSWMFVLAFLSAMYLSRFMVRVSTAKHSKSAGELLSLSSKLLEAHGFSVAETRDGWIRATRNEQRFVQIGELEWRSVPIEVTVSTVQEGEDCRLRVTCFPEMDGTTLCTRTASALAALDEYGLATTDLEIVKPDASSGVARGRIAQSIVYLVFSTAVLIGFALGGMGLWVIGNMVAKESEDFMLARTDEAVAAITQGLEGQLRGQIALAESRTSFGDKRGMEAVQALASKLEFPPSVGIPVVALALDKQWKILLPAGNESSQSDREQDLVDALKFGDSEKLRRAGDSTAYFLSFNATEKLKQRLGMDRGALAVGIMVSPAHLASLAKDSFYIDELRFYQQGRAYARIRFDHINDPAAEGEKSIAPEAKRLPPAVELAFRTKDVSQRAQLHRKPREWDKAADIAEKLLALFFPAARPEFLWRESGAADVFRIEVNSGNAGLSGYAASFKNRYGSLFRQEEVIWLLAAVLWMLLVILPLSWGVRIGNRIAAPFLEIRDAMRIIATGDYSIRIAEEGVDEIGQLQRHLNQMAIELQKREAIKDLMGKYLSKQVADKILEGEGAGSLIGVRREITVLFADVRGFTTYSERHDPEQVTNSLNEYFEIMVEIIASHDGVLDKYIGDGLMVVFGAPVSQPDHARRAVDTALEMQAAIRTLNLKRAQRGDVPIDIGIGINTGLAISGNLGSIKRMEFTVIGDTVNTAARLESRAEKGQILIGKGTYEKVAEFVEVEPMGEFSVKGKNVPVEVWGLIGLKLRRA